MPEFIRVVDKTVTPRAEHSIVESAFIEGVHERLDKPAVHPDGTPIETKYTPKSLSSKTGAGKSADSDSGQKATSDKEAS